jgi:hypothetical protein
MRAKKKYVKIALLLVALSLVAGGVFVAKWYNEGGRYIVRDFVVATIAHIKAGDRVPIEIEYAYTDSNEIKQDWGIYTNVRWLSDYARLIVPHMEYEGLTDWGQGPQYIIMQPMYGRNSYHLLGQANGEDDIIRLNERMIIGAQGPDARRLLSVLVHELIHLQGGDFYGNQSYITEGKTSAATLEILAAMCNYRDELACKTFWYEIEDFARGNLRRTFRNAGLESIYDTFSNILWRDAADERAAVKSRVFWDSSGDRRIFLANILYDYIVFPFKTYIIPGLDGKDMDTGIYPQTITGPSSLMTFKMEFDDSTRLLGIVGRFLVWMTPDEK